LAQLAQKPALEAQVAPGQALDLLDAVANQQNRNAGLQALA
jgi:hypothetical protein